MKRNLKAICFSHSFPLIENHSIETSFVCPESFCLLPDFFYFIRRENLKRTENNTEVCSNLNNFWKNFEASVRRPVHVPPVFLYYYFFKSMNTMKFSTRALDRFQSYRVISTRSQNFLFWQFSWRKWRIYQPDMLILSF